MKEINMSNSNLRDVVDEIIILYTKIPNQLEVENFLNEIYLKYKLSAEQIITVNEFLAKTGLSKLNLESLHNNLSVNISKLTGIQNHHSSAIVNSIRESLLGYLNRKELSVISKELENENLNNEEQLKKEIEFLNIQINNRLTSKKLILNEFISKTDNKNLSANNLIENTEKLLNIRINKEVTIAKVEELLNGNKDIIIEL